MAALKDKLQNALDEGRILILGAQVLVGFQYHSVFERGFTALPVSAQYFRLGALGLMLLALALLLTPVARHQIIEGGEDTDALLRFTTGIVGWALLPFAVGLGIDLWIAAEKLAGRTRGILCGTAATLVALWFWYGLEAVHRSRRGLTGEEERVEQHTQSQADGTEITDKIRHVLAEARMVLPGAQALLGFQFAVMLVDGFD